ncbi:MAG: RsmB/NOP family class I SAM-dependent RNA methyltransferase [Desulfonatronovibrionaceae bacterium]
MPDSHQQGRTRYFRLNCSRRDKNAVLEMLCREGFDPVPAAGLDNVMQVSRQPVPLGASLANYFGFIYIQDLSSMLPALWLAPEPGDAVLDMCASPGGKTCQLSAMTSPRGIVVANEASSTRLLTLRANAGRLNLFNTVTSGYPGQNMGQGLKGFSRILLDVPCSGWGTENKNPGVKKIWTREKAASLTSLQRMLLESASRMLLPGGRLVYSTCTTNEDENEQQVRWACQELGLKADDAGIDFFERLPAPDCHRSGPGMVRIFGARAGAQDFFMASLKAGQKKIQVQDSALKQDRNRQDMLDWPEGVKPLKQGKLWVFQENVFFVPDKAWQYTLRNFRFQGTYVGRVKNTKFLLNPRARTLLPDAGDGPCFVCEDLDLVQGLVQGRSVSIETGKTGMLGLYWNNLGLGWLKIRNRRGFWSDR